MSSKAFTPTERGLRKPTDANQVNGQFINPPTYAQLGGLSSPRKTAARNPFGVEKSPRARGK